MASIQTYETYTKVTLDLGVARTNYVLAVDGDTISVEKCEAQLDIHPDDTEAPPINLNLQRYVSFRPKHFRKLFLTNPAATGKSAVFFIGREASFTTETVRTGDVRLLTVGEVPINPAQEDGNLARLTPAAAITTGQVTVAAAAVTLIVAADGNRKRVTIKNHDPTYPCYLGTSAVSSTTGFLLEAREARTFETTAAIYGIGDGTNPVTVSYISESG